MKIGIFTPLNPVRSGISDYIEELALPLKEYAEIDFFVDGFEPEKAEIKDNFKIYNMDEIEKEELRNSYDVLLYQVGNNSKHHGKIFHYAEKYPGVLELHDFALHNYVAGTTYAKGDNEGYLNMLEYCHGKRGRQVGMQFLNGRCLPPWEERAMEFPANKFWIDKSIGVIVHSDFAKQMIKGMVPEKPVTYIPLHTLDICKSYEKNREKCREKLGIPGTKLVLGSFGFATKTKQNKEIVEALARVKAEGLDFVFYIVGDVQDESIKTAIEKHHLEKEVVVTGFTSTEEFDTYMGACDICLNLRFPTCGESSASLHRMFGLGKAIMVTDIGTFQDYPETIAKKMPVGEAAIPEIAKTILELAANREELKRMQKASVLYADKYFRLEENAKKYADFLGKIVNKDFDEGDYWDTFVDRLVDLHLTNESYVNQVCERIVPLIDEESL